MSASDIVHVFAIYEVIKTSLIDGGDTLAIQLRDTGGDEIAILASIKVAIELEEIIQKTLNITRQIPRTLQFGGNDNRHQARCSVIGDAPITDIPLIFKA